MASRKAQRWRRLGARRDPVSGRCEAAECPESAVALVYIPDDDRRHRLCEPHALAVEFQMRRNKAAAKVTARQRAEEKLGIR